MQLSSTTTSPSSRRSWPPRWCSPAPWPCLLGRPARSRWWQADSAKTASSQPARRGRCGATHYERSCYWDCCAIQAAQHAVSARVAAAATAFNATRRAASARAAAATAPIDAVQRAVCVPCRRCGQRPMRRRSMQLSMQSPFLTLGCCSDRCISTCVGASFEPCSSISTGAQALVHVMAATGACSTRLRWLPCRRANEGARRMHGDA